MKPLFHERGGNIALTFSQNVNSSQQVETALPLFGDDLDASLESSVLGSVIPGLDPDPLDPNTASLSSNAFALSSNSSTPPPRVRSGEEGPGPFTSPASRSDDSSSKPARRDNGCGGPREWTGGGDAGPATRRGGGVEASLSPLAGQGLGVGDGVGAGVGEELAINRRLAPLEHGLRVLLRGSSRCGKSTILWDYCHRAAMAGHRVILVCLKRENEDLSHLPRSMRAGGRPGAQDELRGWDASALSKIGMKYVRSRDDLAWYLASLHTLPRSQWPTVIAVDDIDKILETTAAGYAGVPSAGSGTGGGSGGGALGAAALRIFALLQDTAEFFDNARAEAAAVAAAATTTSRTATALLPACPPPPGIVGKSSATLTPQQVASGSGDAGTNPEGRASFTPPSANDFGNPIESSSTAATGDEEESFRRRAGAGAGSFCATGRAREPSVRVVGTCVTSDRGMLSLYGRFVHVVARVQNTTGPDCFSLKLDPGIGTAQVRPAPPVAQMPLHGVGTKGDGVTVEFVRSQIDGSFSLF